MSFYRQQLEQWLSQLDVKADYVIDVGGAQGYVKDRVKSWDVKKYEVFDLPNDIQDEQPGENADIVFCLEVFEYLIRPAEALVNIADSLRKGGRAYITFAFIYPHHNELQNEGLRYTHHSILRLADYAGLLVSKMDYRIDPSGKLVDFYNTDGMRVAKEYFNHNVTGFIVEMTK